MADSPHLSWRPLPCQLGVWLLGVACLLGVPLAAQTAEERAFAALEKQFQDGLHAFVVRDATAFTAEHTNSTRLTEVILLEARSLIELGRAAEARVLLEAHTDPAKAGADELVFWQAHAAWREGQTALAADLFRRLETEFPQSPRRLEAAVLEARVRIELGQAALAAAQLEDPAGVFQSAAAADPDQPWAARGWLLLAETALELGNLPRAEAALAAMAARPLPPSREWERQLLLARVRLAAGRLPEALAHATNLWTTNTGSLSPALLAEGAALHGSILESLQQTEAAIEAYARNLATNVPAVQRRLAMEKVIGLGREQNPAALTQRLQTFVEQYPSDDLLDLARFALGEGRLAEYYRLAAPGVALTPEVVTARTNALGRARGHFDWLLANRPQSPLAGRAELNRGWTLWEEGPPRLPDALAAFRGAASRLPPSVDRANARFKWADCQAQLGDRAGAVTNYWLVATNHLDAAIPDTLRADALFQIVRTSLQADDLGTARTALPHLARVDGGGELAQRAELLLAQTLVRLDQPEPARAQYESFLQQYTNSVLVPEVRLAVARTFELRGDSGAALSAYASWLAQYTNQAGLASNLLAQATFDFARVSYRSSPDAASVALLTNFVARFPRDPNAPLAQYLVADHAFGAGEYARAELLFLDRLLDPALFQPTAELPYRARLMAGKAAVFRQGWQNAREHFDWIITNGPLYLVSSPIPVPVVAEAYMARGDLFIREPRDGAVDPLAGYAEATNAFARVALQFPTTEWAPRAWGQIGNCYLQLATADPKRYEDAANAYRQVLASPADVALRSMAEVALGLVREKQAVLEPEPRQRPLYEAALAHYLNVVYEKNLRPNELADPPWLKQAGLNAVKLAESLQDWPVALGLYQRLAVELPPLRSRFEKRIEELRALVAAAPPSASAAP